MAKYELSKLHLDTIAYLRNKLDVSCNEQPTDPHKYIVLISNDDNDDMYYMIAEIGDKPFDKKTNCFKIHTETNSYTDFLEAVDRICEQETKARQTEANQTEA